MGVRAKFNTADVLRSMGDQAKMAEQIIIGNLQYVGEFSIKTAREDHEKNYTDRTGNLRASIGYVIAKDGKLIQTGGFDPASATNRTDGQTGASAGKQFAESKVSEFPTGYVLIVVAGMNYGAYVEDRNYKVLTFTEIEAKAKANELMKGMFR